MPAIAEPRATYRLQFHGDFTFRDAIALVPYLDQLGVSHLYASPLFRSTKGSTHGYDVCDYNEFDPEIGTEEEFFELSAELSKRGMSILLDFVPNHMGVNGVENGWWADVLENGPDSAYANYFDIDWKSFQRGSKKQLLLPILGEPYGAVLERGELKVGWGEGCYHVDYLGTHLPLSASSTFQLLEAAVLGSEMPAEEKKDLLGEVKHGIQLKSEWKKDDRSALRKQLTDLTQKSGVLRSSLHAGLEKLAGDFDSLDVLLSAQHYRLCFWKVATEEINYRRFFDVSTLAGLRVEDPKVFADAHRLLLELFRKKAISGVRIDHIDGLAFPRAYLERLRDAIAEVSEKGQNSWILVEKILGVSETLADDWPVQGTTGYEFVSEVNSLLVDSSAEAIITSGYGELTGKLQNFHEEVYQGKRLVMRVFMAGELNALGDLLNQIAESHRWYRDFTLMALTRAIREVIACFPFYRTYLDPSQPPGDFDRDLISKAIALARGRNPELDPSPFEFLRDVLLPPAGMLHPVDETLRQKFVIKFQQSTGPIMAKGVEDTAFYVYNRFSSINEVGSDPARFGLSVEEFHHQNRYRQDHFPKTLIATSTHDTKRGEDVRARLAVLSEMPEIWLETLRNWITLNKPHQVDVSGKSAPDKNEQYLLYQTIVGSWPLESMNEEACESYKTRLRQYMVKALHEAKVNSGWIDPKEDWDDGVREFVNRILTPGLDNQFLAELDQLVKMIAYSGMVNSLTQTVLKFTCPGIPDIYQGNELWDSSLVDPDNRRPVDYARRQKLLASLSGVLTQELTGKWEDGRIKLYVIQKLLELRRQQPSLFANGDYQPVTVSGPGSDCVVAFTRNGGTQSLLVVVPRLSMHEERWMNTKIEKIDLRGYQNIFTATAGSEMVIDMWKDIPLAVFHRWN